MPLYKSEEELEDLVRNFRRRCSVEFQPQPDLMTVITKIKQFDPGFNYGRVPDGEMLTIEAQWDSECRVIWMRESVFAGMQRGEPRARMTVAHELSHYLHGHKGLLNRKTGVKSRDLHSGLLRHQESEARRTGPVILAPEYLVPDGATAEQIAAQFGLSAEAAEYRFEEIQRIRRRRNGELRPLPEGVANFLAEAKRRGFSIRTKLDD